MKSYLIRNFEVKSSDVAVNNELRFDAIQSIFQDLATAHATEMGMSFSALKEKSNAFWVLSKVKFTLQGRIYQNDKIVSKTWPIEPSHIRFLRDFTIVGGSGKILGSSEWCILDFSTQAIRRLSSVNYPLNFKHLTKRSNAGDFSRLKEEIQPENFLYKHLVHFCDIDCNNHVNNVSYCKMALNAFTPKEFTSNDFSGFEIHFLSQSYYGDEIDIYKKEVQNGVYIEGKILDKQIFKALFTK